MLLLEQARCRARQPALSMTMRSRGCERSHSRRYTFRDYESSHDLPQCGDGGPATLAGCAAWRVLAGWCAGVDAEPQPRGRAGGVAGVPRRPHRAGRLRDSPGGARLRVGCGRAVSRRSRVRLLVDAVRVLPRSRARKPVLAYACGGKLSTPGFTEPGDARSRSRKARLQREHWERVRTGTFDRTPLAGRAKQVLNESVDDVEKLLGAVAAAVLKLHQLGDAAPRVAAEMVRRNLNQLPPRPALFVGGRRTWRRCGPLIRGRGR